MRSPNSLDMIVLTVGQTYLVSSRIISSSTSDVLSPTTSTVSSTSLNTSSFSLTASTSSDVLSFIGSPKVHPIHTTDNAIVNTNAILLVFFLFTITSILFFISFFPLAAVVEFKKTTDVISFFLEDFNTTSKSICP